MAKYHINPNTGNPGICKADPSKPNARGCDFDLGESDHYASADEARTAYEFSMVNEATPIASKPVDKKLLQIQAKAALPTEHAFSILAPFSWQEATSAQSELIFRMGEEQQRAEGWREPIGNRYGPKWYSYSDSAYSAAEQEGKLNAERYAAALERDPSDPRPMINVLSSNSVDENSSRVRLTDAEYGAAMQISMYGSSDQEMIYNQPAAFLKVIADTPAGRSNLRSLIKLSNELRETNPNFVPTRGEVPPARTTGRRSEEGVPQMQKIGPYGYGLLQSYARERFGDRAKEFWLTVESTSGNYPKISDFMRAIKEFS